MPATTVSAGPVLRSGLVAERPAPLRRLPGLGVHTLARVPARARQVVLAVGRNARSPLSTVTLYQRVPGGWRAMDTPWPAHNGRDGWTLDHHAGDLRSPVGVFTLTDAGGRLADPGSKLPYSRSSAFTDPALGFNGESLKDAFGYVIAINYNRRTGVSPMDGTRPLGEELGGGIWLHVDHGGPTHACVSVGEAHMRTLLRALAPALHPVIVMGDAADLRR